MTTQNCQSKNQSAARLGIFTKSHPSLDTRAFERVHDFILQDQSAKLLPLERVSNCLKKRIDKRKNRNVMYNENTEKCHYGNVQRCGSIWTCSVCAKKITEQRREELKKAVERWSLSGGHIYMLTITNKHNSSHSLGFLKDSQKKAMKRFFEGRRSQALMARLGKKYHITNYEVTYGMNGWHPHHHVLVFSDKYLGISDFHDLEQDLKAHWINCCKLSNLPLPSMEHGLKLCDGTYAAEYVAKWGIEHEMTKGHIKKGRKESYTPFDLLNLSIEDQEIFGRLPSKLFQEFGIAFKGARQLMWSRGLKALLGLKDKDDQEIVDETLKESIEVYDIPALLFMLLKKYQKRHTFLECLENDFKDGSFGSGSAEKLIEELVEIESSQLDQYEDKDFIKILSCC